MAGKGLFVRPLADGVCPKCGQVGQFKARRRKTKGGWSPYYLQVDHYRWKSRKNLHYMRLTRFHHKWWYCCHIGPCFADGRLRERLIKKPRVGLEKFV